MPAAAERLLGCQTPRIRVAPPYVTSAGRECIELSDSVGHHLDPWQQLWLTDALGEIAGRWAAFEVGGVVTRQSGKGGVLEARQLGGLFLFGEALQIHTAHQFKTTQEHFRRVRGLIEGSDDLVRQVRRIRTADGEEEIELRTGQRLRFVARSGSSGRGFSAETVYLDEAMILAEDAIGALLPTMSARPNPQIWYTGSAGDRRSVVLGRVRRRALAKLADPARDPRLAFCEWSAPDTTTPGQHSDRALWAQANPALGIRLSEEFVSSELAALDDVMFARERLGVGDWPAEDGERWAVIPQPHWRDRAGATGRPDRPVAFGVAASWPDAEWCSIAVAGRRGGELLVQVVDRHPGTGWVLDRVAELRRLHDPVAVVLDPGGPAGHLIADLERAGVELLKPGVRELGQAAGRLLAEIAGDAPTLRHYDQPELTAAAAGAGRRTLGDAWTWARRGPDISALEAAGLAAWGHAVRAKAPFDLLKSIY